jgi:hypothetical protein
VTGPGSARTRPSWTPTQDDRILDGLAAGSVDVSDRAFQAAVSPSQESSSIPPGAECPRHGPTYSAAGARNDYNLTCHQRLTFPIPRQSGNYPDSPAANRIALDA